jgi:ribonuclease P protein component
VSAVGAARARLPKGERLRDQRDIDRVFRQGGRVERRGFVLLWLAAEGRRGAAFAAGRGVGGSVRRNRARRRLREAYRRQRGTLPAHGLRVCIVARPAANELAFGDLVAEMGEAIRLAARRAAT